MATAFTTRYKYYAAETYDLWELLTQQCLSEARHQSTWFSFTGKRENNPNKKTDNNVQKMMALCKDPGSKRGRSTSLTLLRKKSDGDDDVHSYISEIYQPSKTEAQLQLFQQVAAFNTAITGTRTEERPVSNRTQSSDSNLLSPRRVKRTIKWNILADLCRTLVWPCLVYGGQSLWWDHPSY